MAQRGTTKSHKGCRRCKERRVKCDELVPCSNCARRGETCSLLDSSVFGSSGDYALPADGDEWVQDLELMYHFTSDIFMDQLCARPEVIQVWRGYIPRQAFQHRFLMHGLLALSALHLAYLNPLSAAKYLQLSNKHQTIALAKFRTILCSEFEVELADSLFALASILSVSSMANSCFVLESDVMTIAEAAELFYLTKGVGDVLFMAHEHITNGPMAKLIDGYRYPSDYQVDLPPVVLHQFEMVSQMLSEKCIDAEMLKSCRMALAGLEDVYRNLVYHNGVSENMMTQMFRWPSMVSAGFIRLIQAKYEPALVILAYYAAATTAIRAVWFLENWAEYAIRGISLELNANMQDWLSWPTQQARERMAILTSTSMIRDGDS